MIQKIMLWFAKKTYGKKALEVMGGLNDSLSGKRTEIVLAVLAALYGLEALGVTPTGTYAKISPLLYGALPITVGEKVSKVVKQANKLIPGDYKYHPQV